MCFWLATIKTGEIMIIMFVRHAEAKDNVLTELGRKQCEIMCEQEEQYKFSKIYCSSIERCKDTAEYLKNKYKLDVEYLDNLRDREVLDSTPQNKDEKEWYDNYLNKNYSHTNPEGCKEFLQRNFKVFDNILNLHKSKSENVILVAHSCTFYALQEYINASRNEMVNYYRLSNCSRIYFEIN